MAEAAVVTLDATFSERKTEQRSGAWFYFFTGIVAAITILTAYQAGMWFESLPSAKPVLLPRPMIDGGQILFRVDGFVLTADVTSYSDELFAYLMFDYLRSRRAVDGMSYLLVFDPTQSEKPYRVRLRATGDFVAGMAAMMDLQARGFIQGVGLRAASEVAGFGQQTRLFVSAYNLPVKKKLEQAPREALSEYLGRFIRFKSNTDPRIRLDLQPAPKALSHHEALHLAGDIMTVAEFYSLPLEFFVAIGAMENNYMNVRGDLKHSIWKKRPASDDIVLERKGGRVRVLNDSAGVWQITRETLRYVHLLYLQDTRDYSRLPEHLRPSQELRVNEVDPKVLTTYAGLLLRDLLDRFDGDVTLAVSAYNGGPGRPNLRYGEGAHSAASHARRVLEQAAALNGESVMQKVWLR